MARWKLLTPHYLNVPGNSWEYKEVDRSNGRQIRRSFEVPSLLDPNQSGDWNYRNGDDGEIIVTNKPSDNFPRDIHFRGDPTPDMLPLDDEAKAISAKFAEKWKHPIDSLAPNYSQSLLDNLQRQVAEVQSGQTATKPVGVEGMSELLQAMTSMMAQNAALIAALAAPKVEEAKTPRRA